MLTRPSHILVPPDIWDPKFPDQCAVWTAQMISEMRTTIALTRQTVAESRALLEAVDRVLAQSPDVHFSI